mmetsp:Transcript_94182/g.224196  ORF Transcript_94182/g.224196 Transcript_94182/m.224196 type:complete len:200 (-) Transcript_94182:1688-2287(-)
MAHPEGHPGHHREHSGDTPWHFPCICHPAEAASRRVHPSAAGQESRPPRMHRQYGQVQRRDLQWVVVAGSDDDISEAIDRGCCFHRLTIIKQHKCIGRCWEPSSKLQGARIRDEALPAHLQNQRKAKLRIRPTPIRRDILEDEQMLLRYHLFASFNFRTTTAVQLSTQLPARYQGRQKSLDAVMVVAREVAAPLPEKGP